ncbi:MAG: tetratricopeptide repeat protein [Myxococcota bacterium]
MAHDTKTLSHPNDESQPTVTSTPPYDPPQDHDLAVANALDRACLNDNANSCFELGQRYQRGLGVDRNPAYAMELWSDACRRQDHVPSCWTISQVLLDKAQAEHMRKAAGLLEHLCVAKGHMPACNNLAVLVEHGRGTMPDAQRATALYRQACQRGWVISCHNLGLMYLRGRGVESDLEQAAQLFKRTCATGHEAACIHLDELRQGKLSTAPETSFMSTPPKRRRTPFTPLNRVPTAKRERAHANAPYVR